VANRLSQLILAVILALVLGLAALNRAPARPAPPDESTFRALFDEAVRGELNDRDKALDDWAHHRWSQLDAFGALENDRLGKLAASKGLAPQDLFMVVDHGLRAGWPGPDGKPLDVRTVPLKPRAMD
jgi:hypothetical protein